MSNSKYAISIDPTLAFSFHTQRSLMLRATPLGLTAYLLRAALKSVNAAKYSSHTLFGKLWCISRQRPGLKCKRTDGVVGGG